MSDTAPLFPFENSFARLPGRFFARLDPTAVKEPRLIRLNEGLALELGLDPARLADDQAVAAFAGNAVPDGAEPLAMAYAGHQFGNFVPQLGDGRAILLGEVVRPDGARRDIQLKGAGRTPFSRGGDGRAALGPVLREFIVSEAMAALGLPTTRALAAVETGERVFRDDILPGAVLTRVAASHIRVGTFQFFAARSDNEALKTLADYVIERHYQHVKGADNPYVALLEQVQDRQAALIARWIHIGFIHGVMNTDNMTLSGETIDYGPCAFLDAYDSGTVFSSIDHGGRYAFGNQPRIGQWNLARLAETLLPLIDSDTDKAVEKASGVVNGFPDVFQAHWLAGMRAKVGLQTDAPAADDTQDMLLLQHLLKAMQDGHADFTLTFRHLCRAAEDPSADKDVRALFERPALYDAWAEEWRHRTAQEAASPADRAAAMRAVNPAFIPRNHRVEQAIAAAVGARDFKPFETLMTVLARPYEDQPDHGDYMLPPAPGERVFQTFCGT